MRTRFSAKLISLLAVILFQTSAHGTSLTDSLQLLLKKAAPAEKPAILNQLVQGVVQSDPQLAGKYAQEALDLSVQQNNLREKANSLYSVGLARLYSNDYETGMAFFRQSLDLAKKTGNQKVIGLDYSIIGYYYELKSDYATSLLYNRLALDTRKKLGNKQAVAKSLDNIGNVYQQMGRYQDALDCYQQSLEIQSELNDAKGKAELNNNIGIIYFYLTDYKKALRYFQRSLTLKDSLNDKKAVATTLNNIAGIYEVTGDYPAALNSYRKALAIHEQRGSKLGMAIVSANIGTVLSDMKNYPEANEYYRKALALYREKENKSGIATTLGNMGRVCELEGKKEEALAYYKDALKQQETIGDEAECAISLKRIGESYAARGSLREASIYLEKSRLLAQKLGMMKEVMETSSALADVYHRLGMEKEAYRLLSESISIRDSVLSAEKQKEIAELQAKYESGRKDNEIRHLTDEQAIHELEAGRQRYFIFFLSLLSLVILVAGILMIYRQRVVQRRQKEDLIRKNRDMEERLLLSQMNPHFIFNVLNSVEGAMHTSGMEKATGLLNRFSRLMRKNLENSRQMRVPLSSEISLLHDYLELEKERLEGKFIFIIRIGDDLDPDTTFIPPFLVQPLLENAIHHGIAGKDGKGFVSLEIRRQEGYILICVSDDGIGREQAAMRNRLSDKGRRSLGSRLVAERIELFNAMSKEKFRMETEDLRDIEGGPAGTKVVLMIPFETEE